MLNIKKNYLILYSLLLFVFVISCAETDDIPYDDGTNNNYDSSHEETTKDSSYQNTNENSDNKTVDAENIKAESSAEEIQASIEDTETTLEQENTPSPPTVSENAYIDEANINSGYTDPVIFASDFENESQTCWNSRPDGSGNWNFNGCGGFVNIGNGNTVSIAENEASHSGNKSLKITFSVDEDYGGAEVNSIESDHIYTRYYDNYSTNFDFPYGMKIHRIRSFNNDLQINNFDSTLLIIGRPNSGEFDYSNINDTLQLTYGANGGQVDWGSAVVPLSLTRNRWYCIETEMKLNTPGQSNGETRTWIDGNLVIERTNLNIRGTNPGKVNTILFGGWYSNLAAGNNPYRNPEVPAVRYIDDIAVATTRIGCLP